MSTPAECQWHCDANSHPFVVPNEQDTRINSQNKQLGGSTIHRSVADEQQQQYKQVDKQHYEMTIQTLSEQLQQLEITLRSERDMKQVAQERMEAQTDMAVHYHKRVTELEKQLRSNYTTASLPFTPTTHPQLIKSPESEISCLQQTIKELEAKVGTTTTTQSVHVDSDWLTQLKEDNAGLVTKIGVLQDRLDMVMVDRNQQFCENQQLKQQFTFLSDANRHLQDKLNHTLKEHHLAEAELRRQLEESTTEEQDNDAQFDDGLQQYRCRLQSEKTEAIDRCVAADQVQTDANQRYLAEITGLKQEIKALQANSAELQEYSQQREQSIQDAFDKMESERDKALRDMHQADNRYKEILSQHTTTLKEKEELAQLHQSATENLNHVTARLISAGDMAEDNEREVERLTKSLQDRVDNSQHLEKQWKMKLEAERETRLDAVKTAERLQCELESAQLMNREAAQLRKENQQLKDKVRRLTDEQWQMPDYNREAAQLQKDNQQLKDKVSRLTDEQWQMPDYRSVLADAEPRTWHTAFSGYNEFHQPMASNMPSEHRKEPSTCPVCNLELPDADTLQIHVNDCISTIHDRRFSCPLCGSEFSDIETLEIHVNECID